MLWIEAICSNSTQVGQAVVIAAGAAPAALIFSAAARTSRQVLGRAVVDSPAFSKASRFSHITAEEELNGIEISRPWVSL